MALLTAPPVEASAHRAASLRSLFAWRERYRFGWLESAVLTVYCAVLALVIPYHEPWPDEAQAWLIARDNSVWQILRYRLHYEGAPALWHLILRAFQAVGGRYGGMDWLGAAFAVAGVVVLLRWSPFPLVIRVLLPFTFFLQYQYAVIGRSYTLFPVLTFTLCALFRSRRSPLWFALVAGLLANVSLHGVIVSLFLVVMYLYDRFRRQRLWGSGHSRTPLYATAAVYLAFFCAAAVVAVPAPDAIFASGDAVTTGALHDALLHFPGAMPPPAPQPPEPPSPVFPPDPVIARPNFLQHPGIWLEWYIVHPVYDAQGHVEPRSVGKQTLDTFLGFLSQATWPVSTSRILALLFLGTLFLWTRAHRSLRTLAPWAALIVVGQFLWVTDHHAGVIFIALLSAIWLTAESPARHRPSPRLDQAFVLLFALVCAVQVGWTAVSAHNDIEKPYDPGSETAALLQQHLGERMAAFDFYQVAVQPYFKHNPFFNLKQAYWIWSRNGDPNPQYYNTIDTHPDLVLFTIDTVAPGTMRNEWAPRSIVNSGRIDHELDRNPIVYDLRANGYRETHRFCGTRFSRFSSSYRACDVIFEPAR